MISNKEVHVDAHQAGAKSDEISSRTSPGEKATAISNQLSSMGGQLMRLVEKSVIIHKDENGFGLRIKGQSPVFIEHVHENGAAWRAGVRALDTLCKVNGILVGQMDHKEVVLHFKSCSRFVALTLMTPGLVNETPASFATSNGRPISSSYSRRVYQFLSRGEAPPQATLAAHLTNRRLSGADPAGAHSAPFIDRTNSCRLTASLMAYQRGKVVGVIKPAQSKLTRQDSVEAAVADKRLAICICCRTSIKGATGAQGDQPPTPITCLHCQLRYRSRHRHPGGRQRDSSPPLATRLVRASHNGGRTESKQNTERNNHHHIHSSASIKSLPLKTNIASGVGFIKMAPVAAAAAAAAADRQAPQQVNKRVEIIREFIDTERTHTERLRCLNELFYRPLKEAGFVSTEQLRAVFSSHRTLYRIHKQIHRILVSSANYDVYSEPLVGSALVEIFEGDLKQRLERASCSFCSAQATNTELLNKITRRDTKSGELLAQITSQRMVGRLGIKDLLASCFQRLTKYPLLLGNLLKATPQILPRDDEDENLVLTLAHGQAPGHRQRSKSGLSAHQRRARMRAGLSDATGEDEEEGEEEDDSADEYEDEEGPTDEEAGEETDEDEEARQARLGAAEEARRNSRRIMAISLAEEREFIERALAQSRSILVRVNDSIRVAIARQRLKEIWKRTDKYPGVPLIDITKQQVVHEGSLTLRLSKRSFDVYVLLLNNYIIILTREGQDKYRLKFFTPEGKSAASSLVSSASNSASVISFMSGASGTGGGSANNSSTNGNSIHPTNTNNASTGIMGNNHLAMGSPHQTVYSPVFVIDEHLTTRDAATDENGFYLLCKRKDDSRIYEFASRSPAERMKWRDRIQWTIERQIGSSHRRPSCESTLTKSSSEISANGVIPALASGQRDAEATPTNQTSPMSGNGKQVRTKNTGTSRPPTPSSSEPTKIVGTISYVIDDGIVPPSKMESSLVFVDQAIQVNILDGSSATTTAVGKCSQQTVTPIANAQK